jgi:quercetin dioxygenase-like cupin family protein
MARRVILYRWDALPLDKVTEMIARKAVASEHATLTQVYFKKGAVVPLHTHATDLIVYVLQGALRARVGEEDVTVREGEVIVIPAGARHQTESLDDTFVLTIGAGTENSERGTRN